jgi:Arc/MetJ-type ribon-helix-helix transcriptional regulator
MTITLQPDQERAIEEAIRAGAFQSVDEFVDAAIATRELREGPALGELSIMELVDEGRL